MDSFTVAPELKGTKGDIIAARIEVPILVVMIYGIVEFIRLGWSQDYYLYTYAPVLGGVAASVGLFTYFFLVSVERKRSRKTLLVLLGFLPYFYFSPRRHFTNCYRALRRHSKSIRWENTKKSQLKCGVRALFGADTLMPVRCQTGAAVRQ